MQPTSRHTESRHTKSIIPHKLVFVWCLLSAKKKNVCLRIVWMHNTHCIITSLSGKTVLETSIIRYGCLKNIPKTFSVHFLFIRYKMYITHFMLGHIFLLSDKVLLTVLQTLWMS